jgi:8-oxo-dGTP diphosphatase
MSGAGRETRVERVRRIAAYGLCRDDTGRVLLVRASARSHHEGRWFLPGGGVHHGEDPADAARREVAEETGLRVEIDGVRDVVTEVERLPDVYRHQDRLIFDCRVVGGALRDESDGSTNCAAWVRSDELSTLPLMPHVAQLLGVEGVGGDGGSRGRVNRRRGVWTEERSDEGRRRVVRRVSERPGQHVSGEPRRFQRFAAYGLVTEPNGRVLLTLIADGYPGAGRWHLPGGGTDFGEAAADGLRREIVEETGQKADITGLLSASHRYRRSALGPEGAPVDWHGVRVVYRATVTEPTPPQVIEADGSTARAIWASAEEAGRLVLTEIAREMIDEHLSGASG